MRNLKKFLALVLAMMMAFSLMVTANAASDFTDSDAITGEFTEAVAVLEGLGVFEGYPDGTFKPKNSITRAEVATIVYRLATGDVEGKQAHLYADYATFTDVGADHWAAGYINYCANAEWIAGYGNGKFGPNDSVTGYQAAAMILRAVGYGKNSEFVGGNWQVQVANFTRSLGLLSNVNKTTYANTLNNAAPRELIAEILFQAGLIPTVNWTVLLGYQDSGRGALATQNFNLNVGPWTVIDKWGRPGYYWYKNTNTAANRVATIEAKPILEFNTAWKECDVAHELDFEGSETFTLFVNNYQYITDSYRIEATDTVTRVGGQGRITEFYDEMDHPWNGLRGTTRGEWKQSVTMIDTYLATVTKVTERVLDPQGHVVTPAYLYLDVYDGHGVGPATKTGVFFAKGSAAKVNTSEHRLSDNDANFSYAVGDKVLVRGYSDDQQYEYATSGGSLTDAAGNATGPFLGTTGLNHVNPNGTVSQAAKERAAFENNCLLPADSSTRYYWDDQPYTTNGSTALEVVQKADMKTGKQTVTTWNQGKHTVDGTDYLDAMTLYLDVAGTTTGTTFAWYFDTKGNLIGIDSLPNTVNFGVITSIYSSFGQGEGNTDGTAKAIANVLYADGTTSTITIDRFLMSGTAVSTNGTGGGHGTVGTSMTTGANSLDLLPVYDNSTGNVMTTSARSGSSSNAALNGWLHVAPVIAVNASENGSNTTPYHGVLRGNLFKFVAGADGGMTAIEVAGDGNTGSSVYAGHYNGTATAGKLFKNFSYIDLTSATGGTASVRLDADTRIMIRASGTSTSVACYTMATLPGDVTIAAGTEVDWADTDNDGRAEYVYLTGTSEGSLTYGLFYYNGGAAQWNGVDKTGTIFGWLNGEPTTLTFIGETSFTAVRDSQAYAGHLFAVQMTNGVVTAVMQNNVTSNRYLVATHGTALSTFGTNIIITTASGTTQFQVGTANGNPYTATTEAVYLEDNSTNNVGYDASKSTITINGVDTYYLTPNSKVIGLGMGVNQESAILDYLNKSTTNDVTIVYEQSGVKAIVEIYVATDPNVTPSDPHTSYAAVTATGGNVAQTAGISLSNSAIGLTANANFITKNGAVFNSGTVQVSATVEVMQANGWQTVGTFTWYASCDATGLLTNGTTPALGLASGQYRVNATVSNTTIGTLDVAVNQLVNF